MNHKPGKQGQKYIGLDEDIKNGMTTMVKIILDARVFGLIDDKEDCKGWLIGGILGLQDKVAASWDEHGFIPSRLPEDLRLRHTEIYEKAVETARKNGWDPDRDMEES